MPPSTAHAHHAPLRGPLKALQRREAMHHEPPRHARRPPRPIPAARSVAPPKAAPRRPRTGAPSAARPARLRLTCRRRSRGPRRSRWSRTSPSRFPTPSPPRRRQASRRATTACRPGSAATAEPVPPPPVATRNFQLDEADEPADPRPGRGGYRDEPREDDFPSVVKSGPFNFDLPERESEDLGLRADRPAARDGRAGAHRA